MRIHNKITGERLVLKYSPGNNLEFLKYSKDSDKVNDSMVTIPDEELISTLYQRGLSILGVDYEISELDYNWLFLDVSRFIRLFIPSQLAVAEMVKGSNFGLLCSQLISPLNPYIVPHTGNVSTYSIYLSQIYLSHIGIIQEFVTDGRISVERYIPESEYIEEGTEEIIDVIANVVSVIDLVAGLEGLIINDIIEE